MNKQEHYSFLFIYVMFFPAPDLNWHSTFCWETQEQVCLWKWYTQTMFQEIHFHVTMFLLSFQKHSIEQMMLFQAQLVEIWKQILALEKNERFREVWRECWTESKVFLQMYFERNNSALFLNHDFLNGE